MSKLPPRIMLSGEAQAIATAEAELSAAGWELRKGWDPPSRRFDARSGRVVCVGPVGSEEEMAAAVLVAAHGGGVLALVRADASIAARLYEDLSRIGPVEIRQGNGGPALDAEQARLLELLADGLNLDRAAAALGYSRRTASRRLAAARTTLGVSTTAEALTRRRSRTSSSRSERPG